MTDTATEKTETTETGLIVVPSESAALDMFLSENGIDPLLKAIRAEVDSFNATVPTLETAKGRKQIASMAMKVVRSKTAIDAIGKKLVADLKEKPRLIDAERKRWRDTLDAWRDEVRGPLNAWEAAEAEKTAKLQAHVDWLGQQWQIGIEDLDSAGLQARIDAVEAFAITEDLGDFQADCARGKDMALQILRPTLSKRIKQENDARELEERRAAQEKIDQEKREAEVARIAQEQAIQKAKDDAAAAEARHQAELEQARADAAAAEQAAKDAAARREREIEEAHRRSIEQDRLAAKAEADRLQAEAAAAEKAEQERAADKAHRGRINRSAMDAIVAGGLSSEAAKVVVIMIAKGQVPGVTINY